MIILDTSIISELVNPRADENVLRWFGQQALEDLYVSSLTIAELHYGILRRPMGRRRDALEHAVEDILTTVLVNAPLIFDDGAARCYGELGAGVLMKGQNIGRFDIMNAAIAAAHGAAIATRSIRDFQHLDVPLINPFEVSP